ncbi:uncharacterized, partial [Tachysurus ichikawai]
SPEQESHLKPLVNQFSSNQLSGALCIQQMQWLFLEKIEDVVKMLNFRWEGHE